MASQIRLNPIVILIIGILFKQTFFDRSFKFNNDGGAYCHQENIFRHPRFFRTRRAVNVPDPFAIQTPWNEKCPFQVHRESIGIFEKNIVRGLTDSGSKLVFNIGMRSFLKFNFVINDWFIFESRTVFQKNGNEYSNKEYPC